MRATLFNRMKLAGKDAVATSIARALPRSVLFDKRYFHLWEERGIHITLDHFYEPVPNTTDLARHDFRTSGDLRGIDFRATDQLQLLASFKARFSAEYDRFPEIADVNAPGFFLRNNSFEEVDAEILHCMVRHFRPRRVIEIGSGFSTAVISNAIGANALEGVTIEEFVVIDPYPAKNLKDRNGAVTRVLVQPVQTLQPSYFDQLEANDILFIDSSHVLKTGSDVQFEFLHVLPRVRPGVVVHIHDVFLPAEYPREWLLGNHWFWSEQYLLQAFLSFNDRFQVLWAGRYMHLQQPEALASAIRSYALTPHEKERHWPASFWMRRVA